MADCIVKKDDIVSKSIKSLNGATNTVKPKSFDDGNSFKESKTDKNIIIIKKDRCDFKVNQTFIGPKEETPDSYFCKNSKRMICIYSDHMTVLDESTKEVRCFNDKDRNGAYESESIFLRDKIDDKKSVYAHLDLDERKYNVKTTQEKELGVLGKSNKEYLISRVKINGVIDEFTQGKTGDCWLLAGLKSLAGTKKGADIIKKSISQDEKGIVTVRLNGLNEVYKFSPEEIYNAQKKKSVGDADVTAFELAMEKHRLKLLKEKDLTKKSNKNHDITKSTGGGTFDKPLNGGAAVELYAALVDKKSVVSIINPKIVDKDLNEDMYLNKALNFKQQSQENIVMTTSFIESKNNVLSKHEYSVENVSNGKVVLSNPHNSYNKIVISRKDFIENVATMDFVVIK